MVTPNAMLKSLQDENKLTELMMMQEEMKTMPFGAVWDKYCEECGVVAGPAWFDEIKKYEEEVQLKR